MRISKFSESQEIQFYRHNRSKFCFHIDNIHHHYEATSAATAVKQKTRPNKRILPKLEKEDVVCPAYKVFLKLPDGSSLSIPQQTTVTMVPNHSQATNTQFDAPSISSPQTQHDEPILITKIKQKSTSTTTKTGRRNSRTTKSKQTPVERVETTTLKSIKTALAESVSHLSPQFENTADLIKYDSINSFSQSSQSSVTSSLDGLSVTTIKNALNENSNSGFPDLPTSSPSSSQSSITNSKTKGANSKSKPGRKGKNQLREDPNEKKSRSLKRNREVVKLDLFCCVCRVC